MAFNCRVITGNRAQSQSPSNSIRYHVLNSTIQFHVFHGPLSCPLFFYSIAISHKTNLFAISLRYNIYDCLFLIATFSMKICLRMFCFFSLLFNRKLITDHYFCGETWLRTMGIYYVLEIINYVNINGCPKNLFYCFGKLLFVSVGTRELC